MLVAFDRETMYGFDLTVIFVSLLLGIIGVGYFSYGKKNSFNFLFSGLVLLIFPYFVDQLLILITIGIFFVVLPFPPNKPPLFFTTFPL